MAFGRITAFGLCALVTATLTGACSAGSDSGEPLLGTSSEQLPADPIDPDPTLEPPLNDGPACTNPSVVVIRDRNGATVCSAAVLASDLLLTSGHCLLSERGSLLQEVAEYSIATGQNPCAHGPSVITGVLKHPHFMYGTPGDVAVVSISPPLSGATAVSFGTPAEGMNVTLTGYGNSSATGGSGTERCLDGTAAYNAAATRLDIDFGTGHACQGDSGGPIFERGTSRVVGVLYGGTSANCASTGLASTDLQFARDAVTNRPPMTTVSCQPDTHSKCLRAGRTCPAADKWCQFDERKCQANGTWGACQERVQPTYMCGTNSGEIWDVNQCACVSTCGNGACDNGETATSCPADCSTGGGGGGDGSGGSWGGGSGGGWGGGDVCYEVWAADACYWGGTGTASVCYSDWGFWYEEYNSIDCYAG